MSFNTTLQSNNTDLQTILDAVNALPEASNVQPVEQATPDITVNANGLITATVSQSAGYVSAGSKSATKQLAFQAAKTITPTTVDQIVVSSGYYTGGVVKVKGDSNLVAENIKSGVSIFGVSGTLTGGGNDGYNEADNLITRTMTSCTNSRVSSIGSGAFAYAASLQSVSFPAVTNIGASAFYFCSSLTSVSFPVATSIGIYAFYGCRSLPSVNFPSVTNIAASAFLTCSSLTSVSFPVATSIGSYAFANCSSLASVNFPSVTVLDTAAFSYCNNLTSISFPVLTRVGSYAFAYCYSLTSANFPAVKSIWSNAFCDCTRLTLANFSVAKQIRNSAFRGCGMLSSLILGVSAVCTLSHSNAFSSTPYAGYSFYFSGTPYIYVPSSLLTTYQSATNWAYYSSYFSAIEDMT